MKWTKLTDHLYTTDSGHKIRKVNGVYNVFQGGKYIGSSAFKGKALNLMKINPEEHELAEQFINHLGD